MSHKIGIMTWYKYQNFGTALQAVALPYVLKKNGYDAKLIDYTPRRIGKVECKDYPLFKMIYKKAISVFLGKYKSKERDELFKAFLDKVSKTEPTNTYSELANLSRGFDAIICGSDQIWSPLCFDDKYYLSFVSNPNKKIAYAPSFGVASIKNKLIKQQISDLLEDFTYLSVREQQGADIISELCEKNTQVVLDPTLLLSSDEWDDIIDYTKIEKKINETIKQKYIVCYFLGDGIKYKNYVKSFSKRTNLPVFCIPMQNKGLYDSKTIFKMPFDVGPAEFVGLIKNAEYVLTDSFHAFAFSVIYNKKFIIFERFKKGDSQNQNSRIYNLANILSLNHCIVDYHKKGTVLTDDSIDYCKVNKVLDVEKRKSLDYLFKSIGNAILEPHKQIHSVMNNPMCCGCAACEKECPVSAIKIRENEKGFLNCVVDESICIQCGKCVKICPFHMIQGNTIENSLGLFSAYSRNTEVLRNSSSGGLSYEISNYCLENNYVVGGCSYDQHKEKAVHAVIESKEKQSIIQGSKYLQSDFSSIYELISCDKKTVVFGLPCQIAGLHNVLSAKKIRNNFILVDLICHGVPSQNLWRKYLGEIKTLLGNDYKSTTVVSFRDKNKGWQNKHISIKATKKTYDSKYEKDNFGVFFELGNCSMHTCFECPYRDKTVSDIRLGDYWGNKFVNNKKGVSMVSVMTPQGLELLKQLKTICLKEQPIDDYYKVQYPYNQQKPIYYNELMMALISDEKLKTLRKKYCKKYEIQSRLGRIYLKFSHLAHKKDRED